MPANVLTGLRRRLDPLARQNSPLSALPRRETRFESLSSGSQRSSLIALDIDMPSWGASSANSRQFSDRPRHSAGQFELAPCLSSRLGGKPLPKHDWKKPVSSTLPAILLAQDHARRLLYQECAEGFAGGGIGREEGRTPHASAPTTLPTPATGKPIHPALAVGLHGFGRETG
jgi:hypothetical protein